MSKLRTMVDLNGMVFAVRRDGNWEVVFVDGKEIGVAFERVYWQHAVVAPRGRMGWLTRKADCFGGYHVVGAWNEIGARTLKEAVEDLAYKYRRNPKAPGPHVIAPLST
ncbi:hypothetical protein [Microvirga splendida]|uniref:Uncharacterized protein n=1 Tax=Microvirga splendida TaxID=2795727 RepID=A0ABS0Y053_9HYPH|nr:hypothetical protein [Microvirga splendida]MBJ6125385.1 hypothetical protein [Microvirga splendida]